MSLVSQPVYFFLVLGIAAVLIELLILQLGTFWLLFVGIGALFASLLLFLFPQLGWLGGTAIFAVDTVATTFVLYKPLKRWQNAPSPMKGNDALGQIAEVIETIAPGLEGTVTWSGTEWQAKLQAGVEESITVGQEAEIVEVSGITLFVRPKSES